MTNFSNASIDVLGLFLAGTSVLLWLWQYGAGRCFLNSRPGQIKENELPGVSVLKPVGAFTPAVEESLRTWLEQDYPAEVEVLFGVDRRDRETCSDLRALLDSFADVRFRLIECAPSSQQNPKAAKLAAMARAAKFEILAAADADVRAAPDLLKRIVSEFLNANTDLASCLYRITDSGGWAQRMERVSNNVDFWSQVTQARTLGPMDFALGAAMAVRKTSLTRIGGFEASAPYLADDYQLGRRMRREGGTVSLLSTIVDCRHETGPLRAIADRQLRWARTMRICRPVSYFMSALSNPTVWPLVYYGMGPSTPRLLLLLGCLTLRIGLSRDLLKRFQNTSHTGGLEWWTPAKDVLQCLLWIGAFLGNRVKWAGQIYRVSNDGRILERRDQRS